jgi:predicted AAA+ superfamily ATPase
MSQITDNMYKALGLFIEALRPYIVSILTEEYGEEWERFYVETLYDNQRPFWHEQRDKGQTADTLIDFQNIKGFAIKFKDLLLKDFGDNAKHLPTWFDEIKGLRNKCAHHQEITKTESNRAYNNMILIAEKTGMTDLKEALEELKEGPKKKEEKPAKAKEDSKVKYKAGGTLTPWFQLVKPHFDIKQGRLDESIFAANLSEVSLDSGREIYQNAALFFEKTYFTAGLKTVARRVIRGLNGDEDAENRVISLQTGFGGGKTHTLISLFHLSKWGKKASTSQHTSELVEYTGEPKFEKANVAVFTNQTNDPVQGRKTDDGTHLRTLWGELAWQLGGKKTYEIIRENDEKQIAPKGGLFKKVLEEVKPALILVDELADYCVSASGVTVGGSNLSDQTISFIQALSESIAESDKVVGVITLPKSEMEVGNSAEAKQILNTLENRLSRVGADTKPVAEGEIFEVVRRRLFEDIGNEEAIEQTVSAYMQMYERLGMELPPNATSGEYRKKLKASYPFHPELIDMFRIRWASYSDFQRTRGVLRLLASIVSDLWKRRNSLPGQHALIHTSDVDFSNLDALCGQLMKLHGNGYEAVINGDVSGSGSNAWKIDDNKKEYGDHRLTQGICSTILLGTFGRSGANKGVSVKEIKLNLLRPDAFNHNNVNGALDALESTAHYLYYSSTGSNEKYYWFQVQPNINILVNQARKEFSRPDVNAEILKRLREREHGINLFRVLIAPDEEVPEQKSPALIILDPKYLKENGDYNKKTKEYIERVATRKGNSDRIYKNTLIFLVGNELGYSKLKDTIQDFMACSKIREEYRGQLEKDQMEDLKNKMSEASKKIEMNLVNTYVNVVKYAAKEGLKSIQIKSFKDRIDYQVNASVQDILLDQEWMIDGVGLNTLKKNNLFPEPGNPVNVKRALESFLRFDDKPLIKTKDGFRNKILEYCRNGAFAIAAGEEGNYTKTYLKEELPFFDAEDESYWLIDPSEHVYEAAPSEDEADPIPPGDSGDEPVEEKPESEDGVRTFKSIRVSGDVNIIDMADVLTFARALKDNRVRINLNIEAQTTATNPISENSKQYQIAKETAKQLGLKFEEE